MAKQSTALSFRYYIWLADTIYTAGRITREEINRKWHDNNLVNPDEALEIPERTFHNWKYAIQDLFELIIECDHRTKEYYIENAEDMARGGIRTWLVNTFAVNNLINESHQIKNQILFEQIPSGRRFLTTIIEAMRDKKRIEITHQKFGREQNTFKVDPYCVKVYQQRWYLLGQPENRDGLRVYGLDRIHQVNILGERFELPKDFDPECYFSHTVGVSGMECAPQQIRVRVENSQANYLRTLPLHHTQVEVEQNEEYSIFEFNTFPSFEFQQHIRSLGTTAEVLAPETLRRKFAEEAKKLVEMYK